MMRTMSWPGSAAGALLALGALSAAGIVATAGAQQVRPRVHVEREECRCVDRDGKPLEHCTCFTIPDVDRIVTRAIAAVTVRPRLGVTLSTDDAANALGARVESVLKGGPAEESGIREGDVITRVDGHSLLEPLEAEEERALDRARPLTVQRLTALVRGIDPGSEVQVEYLRGGESHTAAVKTRDLEHWSIVAPDAPAWNDEAMRERLGHVEERLGELRIRLPRDPDGIRLWADSAGGARIFFRGGPGERNVLMPSPGAPGSRLWACPDEDPQGGFLFAFPDRCIGGLQLVPLNPGLASYFGTDAGVLVAAVHEESRLGLQAGDVVVAVAGREATDPDRLRRILGSYGPDEEVAMRVVRQKREISVSGTLGR